MKNKLIPPVPAIDRPATWEEISRADFTSPEHVIELFLSHGTICESDSDEGGKIAFPAEEFEFCAYLADIPPSQVN